MKRTPYSMPSTIILYRIKPIVLQDRCDFKHWKLIAPIAPHRLILPMITKNTRHAAKPPYRKCVTFTSRGVIGLHLSVSYDRELHTLPAGLIAHRLYRGDQGRKIQIFEHYVLRLNSLDESMHQTLPS